MLLEYIYGKGVIHDDHQMMIKIFFMVQVTEFQNPFGHACTNTIHWLEVENANEN